MITLTSCLAVTSEWRRHYLKKNYRKIPKRISIDCPKYIKHVAVAFEIHCQIFNITFSKINFVGSHYLFIYVLDILFRLFLTIYVFVMPAILIQQ